MNNGNLELTLQNGSNGSTRVGNTKRPSRSIHWCFTWNTPYMSHMYEENIKKFITLLANGSNGSKKYVFQEEIGENGNDHLQGYIAFNNKSRPFELFKKHFPNIHWEKCRSPTHSIAYCSNKNKRRENGKIWVKGIHIPETVKCLEFDQLYPWQREVVDKLSHPNDRTVYWFWDPEGNVGKSALVKFLCLTHDALLLSGKGSDMKYGVVSYKEKNGVYPALIIVDIPRTVLDYVSYSAIEEVKNGCFFSGKYEAQMCVFNNPSIFCFANEKPKTEKMSKDRWKIAEIRNKELYWQKF